MIGRDRSVWTFAATTPADSKLVFDVFIAISAGPILLVFSIGRFILLSLVGLERRHELSGKLFFITIDPDRSGLRIDMADDACDFFVQRGADARAFECCAQRACLNDPATHQHDRMLQDTIECGWVSSVKGKTTLGAEFIAHRLVEWMAAVETCGAEVEHGGIVGGLRHDA